LIIFLKEKFENKIKIMTDDNKKDEKEIDKTF
jgi:hypothetical protein